MAQVVDDLRSNGTRKNPFTKMKMESFFHTKTKSITLVGKWVQHFWYSLLLDQYIALVVDD
jgi:hypothetical protein